MRFHIHFWVPCSCIERARMALKNDPYFLLSAFQPLNVNPEEYDVIFIGYPIWWYTLPMVLYTFFDTYDLAGKTIVPFNTHAGSGDGGTYNEIADFEPDAAVLDGLALSGSSVGADSAQQIDTWLSGLHLR